MDYIYILKIIKGECTPEDKEYFFKQVSEDKLLEQEYVRIKNEYTVKTLPYNPITTVSFDEGKIKLNIFTRLIKIAAVLSIPLMLYFVYDIIKEFETIKDQPTIGYESGVGVKYTVNSGIKASLTLPDNTQVWLNSGSSLKIPDDFSMENRTILLSGEGYFDVKSDSSSPFIINTPKDITLRVTGTEFNLSCYENDNNMIVTLLKGSLQLISPNDEVIAVKTEEQVIIEYESLQNKLETKTDTEYAIAWKKGFLRFNNTPLEEVLRKLERWYGVNITIRNQDVLNHNFTADFASESITQVLELLKITTLISYEIAGNNVILYMQK